MDIEVGARLFKVLGDETRLKMVCMMAAGECCVCQFTDLFPMSQPAISQHVGRLRELGLVRERRDGKWVYYRLDEGSVYYDYVMDLVDGLEVEELPEVHCLNMSR